MPPTSPKNRAAGPSSTAVPSDTELKSFVLTSPADPLLSQAIADTLNLPPTQRASFFTKQVLSIEEWMAPQPDVRPWVCKIFTGLDGSAIFRGGIGHSLVIDPAGRLWRARSYEDFRTTYRFVGTECEIETLAPLYAQMREYLPR